MLLNIQKAFPDIVQECRIIRFRQIRLAYELVAFVELTDHTVLHIRDYLFAGGSHKYAYHWQDAHGCLITRWDNATHWPDISSFPHHVHLKTGEVVASAVRSLFDAMEEIKSILTEGGTTKVRRL